MSAMDRWVEVDELRIHYRVVPVAEGSVAPGKELRWLVFVHGAGCDLSFWEPVVAGLSGTHPLLLVDLPGHGASSTPPGDCTMAVHAAALRAALHAEVARSVVLIAHSMGACVVRQLVCGLADGASPTVEGILVLDGYFVLDDPEQGALYVRYYDVPEAEYLKRFGAFVETFFTDETTEATREKVRRTMLGCPQSLMLSQIAAMYEASLWEPAELEMPVSVLIGRGSTFPPGYEARLRREVHDLEFRSLGDAGHFLMQDRTNDVLAAIHRLLERADSAAPSARKTVQGGVDP
jgi:pimeloyl-ACP methyl ester carboxylesterase